MTKLTLLILAVSALAAPAGAQGLVATSSVGGVLAGGQVIVPQPDLRERRALALAAFKTPPQARTAGAISTKQEPSRFEAASIEPKDEWLDDDGFRILVNRIAYRTRF